MVTHVAFLVDGKSTSSAIIKSATVFDACGFYKVECVILKTENDLAFQDLFQSLTREVTTEEYVTFGGDVETHKDVRRLQRIRMSEIAHDD